MVKYFQASASTRNTKADSTFAESAFVLLQLIYVNAFSQSIEIRSSVVLSVLADVLALGL